MVDSSKHDMMNGTLYLQGHACYVLRHAVNRSCRLHAADILTHFELLLVAVRAGIRAQLTMVFSVFYTCAACLDNSPLPCQLLHATDNVPVS